MVANELPEGLEVAPYTFRSKIMQVRKTRHNLVVSQKMIVRFVSKNMNSFCSNSVGVDVLKSVCSAIQRVFIQQ